MGWQLGSNQGVPDCVEQEVFDTTNWFMGDQSIGKRRRHAVRTITAALSSLSSTAQPSLSSGGLLAHRKPDQTFVLTAVANKLVEGLS